MNLIRLSLKIKLDWNLMKKKSRLQKMLGLKFLAAENVISKRDFGLKKHLLLKNFWSKTINVANQILSQKTCKKVLGSDKNFECKIIQVQINFGS